jgi:hypothetical protein
MMEDPNPFDLVTLRVDPERMRQPARPKKWRRQFVRVPWHWVECLQTTRRVGTYRLALVLLYEHWRTGGRPIALSNVFALAEGLPARTKWRALAELEGRGLVQVKRRRRHAPRVVLRHLAREPS